jgi:lysophospholipase L1-like esterase
VDSRKRKILIWSIVGGVAIIGITTFFILRKKRKKIKCKQRILFLGNSQTASTRGYVEKLQKECGTDTFKKLAKVGAKSDWILEQYQKEIQSGNKYDVVSVMIGGNDIFARKSIDKTKKNLDTLFGLAKKNKSKVIVLSSPTKLFYSKTEPIHLQLADELEDWLNKNKNVDVFIPITKKTENKELFASDNLHLNQKGQELVFNELNKLVS